MPDITLEEIQEKFESLPENLRMAIVVAGADKKVNSIGREHGLNIKQISELLLRTHLVMFGFVHPDKLEDLVKTITKIPPQVIKGTTRDINQQIIKDIKEELLTLTEKPENAKEVESFIAKTTPGGTSMTPEELTDKFTSPLLATSELAAPNKARKEDEILKSTGIEIPILESETEIDKSLIKIDKEIEQTENKIEIAPTSEDIKNSDILKSAGIEIPLVSLENKLDIKETPKPAEEKKEDTKENAELMKIAFEGIPKETPPPSSLPYFTPITPKEENVDVIPQVKETPSTEKEILIPEKTQTPTVKEASTPTQTKQEDVAPTVKPKEETRENVVEKTVPSGIYSPVTPELKIDPISKPETTKEGAGEKPIEQIQTQTQIETKKEEPVKPTEPLKTEVQLEILPEKPKEVENKTPEVSEQTPEEKKKSQDLKLAVKNIINIYQEKSKNPSTPAIYGSAEEEKRHIVVEIVEVQENLKKIKERLNQLTKERSKLEKEKHALAGKGKTKESEDVGDTLSELSREEKMIQVLRESILPKEYLDLLVKLDKLSTHNPPGDTHK